MKKVTAHHTHVVPESKVSGAPTLYRVKCDCGWSMPGYSFHDARSVGSAHVSAEALRRELGR